MSRTKKITKKDLDLIKKLYDNYIQIEKEFDVAWNLFSQLMDKYIGLELTEDTELFPNPKFEKTASKEEKDIVDTFLLVKQKQRDIRLEMNAQLLPVFSKINLPFLDASYTSQYYNVIDKNPHEFYNKIKEAIESVSLSSEILFFMQYFYAPIISRLQVKHSLNLNLLFTQRQKEISELESKDSNKSKFKMAGIFADEILKPHTPSIFDSLNNNPILQKEEQSATMDVGFNHLTSEEIDIILIFCKVLERQSKNTSDKSIENYYLGKEELKNHGTLLPTQSSIEQPNITVSFANLLKEYTNNGDANTRTSLKNIINKFKAKEFYVRYNFKNSDGILQSIEGYEPAFNVYKYYPDKENNPKVSADFIRLNPIFRTNILNKYITVPYDFKKNLEESYKKVANKQRGTVPKGIKVLALYLYRAKSNKNTSKALSIGIDKLIELVPTVSIRSNKSKSKIQIELALEVLKDYGLISGWEEGRSVNNAKIKYSITFSE